MINVRDIHVCARRLALSCASRIDSCGDEREREPGLSSPRTIMIDPRKSRRNVRRINSAAPRREPDEILSCATDQANRLVYTHEPRYS